MERNVQHRDSISAPLDDVGVHEIFEILFNGKAVIAVCVIISIIIGVVYGIYAPERWTSHAEITLPHSKDYSELSEKSAKLISIISDNDTKKEIQRLTNNKELYSEFVLLFNSYDNKKEFLSKNEYFNRYLKENNINTEDDINKAYNLWIERIKLTTIDDKIGNNSLTFQSNSASSSQKFLIDYINYTQNKNVDDVKYDINQIVKINIAVINSALKRSIYNAKQKLNNLIDKNNYALNIAESAGISEPIPLYKDDGIFPLNEGYKALKEKGKVLLSIKDYDILNPNIGSYEYELGELKKYDINDNLNFKSYRFIQDVTLPIAKDAPKKKLIVILCTLLGLITGVFLVLLRSKLNRK